MSKNVYQRLAEAMREVTYIEKAAKGGMPYRAVMHDAVTAKVRPALLEAGIVYHPANLSYKQDGNRTEVELTLRFVNIDDKADFFDVPSLGYGNDGQDKGPGKAISYAVKYGLLKAMGLETGDDPDKDDIPHHRFAAGEKDKVIEGTLAALDAGDSEGLKEIMAEYSDPEEKMKVWALFNSSQRNAIKELMK